MIKRKQALKVQDQRLIKRKPRKKLPKGNLVPKRKPRKRNLVPKRKLLKRNLVPRRKWLRKREGKIEIANSFN
jgi:hypothetical protein